MNAMFTNKIAGRCYLQRCYKVEYFPHTKTFVDRNSKCQSTDINM